MKIKYIIIGVALFLFVREAKAEIYKYVDERGVVHFSNVPTEAGYKPIIEKKKGTASLSSTEPKHYDSLINTLGEKYSVDPALIKAVIKVESDFNPGAVSNKGASGIMQLMPKTASDLKVNNLFNSSENMEGGVKYLKYLLNLFNNNLSFAIAAYNAGENSVKKYGSIPPYEETQSYVRKVLAYYKTYSHSIK